MTLFPNMRLSGILQDPDDCLQKLYFNRQVFARCRRDPKESLLQGFALIDFAQASVTMHQWTQESVAEGAYPRAALRGRELHDWLLENIRWSRQLRAVANGAKHRRQTDPHWPEGHNYISASVLPEDKAALEREFDNAPFAASAALLRAIREGRAKWTSTLKDPSGSVEAMTAIDQHLEDWEGVLEQFRG